MNTPITQLPDGSGCFTATILSNKEIAQLPLKDRPISHRISSEMYMAVWDAIGAASNTEDTEEMASLATGLCFKIAEELEKRSEVA